MSSVASRKFAGFHKDIVLVHNGLASFPVGVSMVEVYPPLEKSRPLLDLLAIVSNIHLPANPRRITNLQFSTLIPLSLLLVESYSSLFYTYPSNPCHL
mmetsp:Transcript_26265/g.34212  ORF Transcript_26265/g.34212 Transcript_26265/m.34212 type:complete len:98 (+) Transcript_26265:472-765(+)